MKRLLTLVAFFATVHASAQQVNPVPDYVFANRMSAGRNTVTDTAAYFSIGPRYGATRGMMPPMVVDTASFSANKRNGLLIFSVQKNKFLYWDSVGVKWAEMAGTGGTAISSGDTAAMLLPYVRHAGYGLTKSGQSFLVDTLNISTRAWRQKGLDSLGILKVEGSGTINRVPKFVASDSFANSLIFDNGTNVGIGTTIPSARLDIRGSGTQSIYVITTTNANTQNSIESYYNNGASWSEFVIKSNALKFQTGPTGGPLTERATINSSGEFIIDASATDAGDYKLQVVGNVYTTGSITTGAPSGGSIKPWKIGEAATVSPTSPNRTIRVEIDGTVYYLHAKTTND